uniref:Uncharacterized protein n=1 Tax=Pyramimonas obovata TaxID=1411642 RepID=A0A7S0WV79_9CHLO|mmetsp:Transcript_45/g.105  ORF Transcript_45/g.105 Transcript_45/m.105 type:complete len:271 (+) Transcript_45:431-1243(+)
MRRSLTLRATKCFSDAYLAAQLQEDPTNEDLRSRIAAQNQYRPAIDQTRAVLSDAELAQHRAEAQHQLIEMAGYDLHARFAARDLTFPMPQSPPHVHLLSGRRVWTAPASGAGLPCSSEAIDAMSSKELRAFLAAKGMNTSGCFERSEYVSLAKSTLPGGATVSAAKENARTKPFSVGQGRRLGTGAAPLVEVTQAATGAVGDPIALSSDDEEVAIVERGSRGTTKVAVKRERSAAWPQDRPASASNSTVEEADRAACVRKARLARFDNP